MGAQAAGVTDIWAVLLPVIIGGVIASVSGVLGPWVSHLVTEGSSRRKARRDRFEAMFEAVYAHKHWLGTQANMTVYGQAGEEVPSPLSKVTVIATLDFPELLPTLNQLEAKIAEYELWMRHAAQKRLRGELQELNAGFGEAYRPYLKALSELERAFTLYAAKL